MTNEISTNTQAINAAVIKKDAPVVRDGSASVSVEVQKVETVQSATGHQEATPSGNSMPVVSQQAATPSNAEVQEFVHQMQDHVQSIARDLKFSIDNDSGRTVVKVIDSETDEVVRQIPSEEILDLIHAMKESGSLLVEAEA